MFRAMFQLIQDTSQQQLGWTLPDTVNTVKCSWWWAKTSPETCRADLNNKLIYTVHLVSYFHSYSSTFFLFLALDGGGWSPSHPSHYTREKDTVLTVQGAGWAHESVWTSTENDPSSPSFDPQTVQPVACCYTNCAVPAHQYQIYW
jgi:hypothetical protein